jgi:hypothetical protein
MSNKNIKIFAVNTQKQYDFFKENVRGDGNCFFRSFLIRYLLQYYLTYNCLHLKEDGNVFFKTHEDVRTFVVNCTNMNILESYFKNSETNDYPMFKNRIGVDGNFQFVFEPMLIFLSEILNIRICIYSYNSKIGDCIQCTEYNDYSSAHPYFTIELYFSHGHYQILINKETLHRFRSSLEKKECLIFKKKLHNISKGSEHELDNLVSLLLEEQQLKRQEEEQRKRQEDNDRVFASLIYLQEEEQRKRQEEQQRKRQEEEQRKRQEEEQRKRQEEEQRKRQEDNDSIIAIHLQKEENNIVLTGTQKCELAFNNLAFTQ